MLLFIHHYVIMNHFIWTFKFIITGSTDVIAVMESVFVYKLSACSWVWACW